MSAFKRVPLATYRLQMNADFPFESAFERLDYLRALGISDLYLSPIMRARTGSGHGYDVIDPTEINPDLGGDAGFARLSSAARERGMGILLDIVPNHMATDIENRWWLETLRDGPESPSAAVFDIFWDDEGKLLLPVLGDHYPDVLARDELAVVEQGGQPFIAYYDDRFPITDSLASRSALEEYHAAGGGESRREALDRLVAAQHYRLGYWRTGAREINYRRFFDINELVALSMGSESTFQLFHERLKPLVEQGLVTGLRIDHIDGLRDPLGYLRRLQGYLGGAEGQQTYVVAEKILTGEERLPEAWPVAGTTGYDFTNMSLAALTSTQGLHDLVELTREYAPPVANFADVLHEAKRFVIDELFPSDTARLTRWLARIARDDRYGRDLIADEIRGAIREVTACMPVYRTYIAGPEVHYRDRELLEGVIEEAIARRPELHVAIVFLGRVLLLDGADRLDDAELRRRLDFVAGWQQFSGPAMAKGLEDTTLYRDPTLISANAVGGEREVAEASVEDFHRWAGKRAKHWPHTMNSSSTHDSKRSEDVSARIAVLAEIPDAWRAAFESWREATASDVRSVDDLPVPDGRAALFIFQTLLGSWPLHRAELDDYRERVKAYAVKAEREAKLRTTWTDQNEVYETALQSFIDNTLDNEAFIELFLPFQERVAFHGMLNSLSLLLMKITTPGLPDFYQGSDLWDLSLADPDNRRPVDFDLRAAMLADVESQSPAELLADWPSGAVKLTVAWKGLQARAQHRSVFERGDYIPLDVHGKHARHVIAYARAHEGQWAITIVPRVTALLAEAGGYAPPDVPLGAAVWGETEIVLPAGAPGAWTDVFTGARLEVDGATIRVAETLREFPVTLLVSSN